MNDGLRKAAFAVDDLIGTSLISIDEIEKTIRDCIGTLPAWHDKPTCAGWWIIFRTELRVNRFILVKLRDSELSANESCGGVYCYGPVSEMPEMVAIPPTEGATT